MDIGGKKEMWINVSAIVSSFTVRVYSITIHGRESLEMKFLLRKSLSLYYYTTLYYIVDTGCTVRERE